MVTLYYVELFPLIRIRIPVQMASQMVTISIFRDESPSQGQISIPILLYFNQGIRVRIRTSGKILHSTGIHVGIRVRIRLSGNKPLQSHLSSAFSFARLWLMGHLHCRRRTRIPNLMATLYYGEHVHIAQTQTQIPTLCVCIGQESESVSISESVSGNINEPLQPKPSTSEGNRETEKNYCFFR